jgi:RHS repeat-associated protein
VERYYAPDTLGSTAMLLDGSGTVTDTYSYWPYGEIRNHTGSSTTPLTFVGTLGYYLDLVANWFYVRARYYQQVVSRWLTVDPLWPRLKPYGYARNQPMTHVDPNGLSPICVVPCACAAACVIDMLAICADWTGFTSYSDCLWKTFQQLPGWLKFICGGCIVGCIACLVRKPPALPPPDVPDPVPPGPEPPYRWPPENPTEECILGCGLIRGCNLVGGSLRNACWLSCVLTCTGGWPAPQGCEPVTPGGGGYLA